MDSSCKPYQLPWQTKDPNDLPHKLIEAALSNLGFCVLSCPDVTIARILDLAQLFGPIQFHERADANGVVDISNRPNDRFAAEQYRGLSNGAFPPHTDGAYLDILCQGHDGKIKHLSPPAIIILQCVTPADKGGETILIDAEEVFQDVATDDALLEALLADTVIFQRAGLSSAVTSVYRVNHAGKISCRFRHDLVASNIAEPWIQRFFQDYLESTMYQTKLSLSHGDILVLDNFRMLHSRTAFVMNNNSVHRQLRRIWVADHWGYQNLDLESDSKIQVGGREFSLDNPDVRNAFPRSTDTRVRNYDWLPWQSKHLNSGDTIRIEPDLGIKIPMTAC